MQLCEKCKETIWQKRGLQRHKESLNCQNWKLESLFFPFLLLHLLLFTSLRVVCISSCPRSNLNEQIWLPACCQAPLSLCPQCHARRQECPPPRQTGEQKGHQDTGPPWPPLPRDTQGNEGTGKRQKKRRKRNDRSNERERGGGESRERGEIKTDG